ncbi:hypothetical protein R3I93_021728 [Phoxinus phoxinus]|uniref:Fibronectin type-III domain-containing protein n=1 Tax=Phoxinus phoxinus TaxID=58324 RepID=A0AAN9C6Y0_9TELE
MHRSSFILTLISLSDVLASVITLGDQYSLECLSDYLSSITCSLNISEESLGNGSSRLHFRNNEEDHNCTLRRGRHSLLCELDLSPLLFTDADSYEISLHSGYHGNNFSLVDVRPLPPSNLSLLWEKDRALFQWESGYDPDTDFSLIRNLQYQLSVCSEHKLYEVEAVEPKVYMDESRFEPHTSYTVRVRSQPDQVIYKGVWSLWAPAIHWRSGDILSESGWITRKQCNNGAGTCTEKTSEISSNIAWYFLPLSFLLVLLSCIPYSRWRKYDYIPSPAPYFRDWDVDVQICSKLSGKDRDVMQGEESLHIDIVRESTDTPPQRTSLVYEMGTSDQDDPTPQSPSMPHSPVGSDVDSGCWIRDFAVTERGSITCSEDYCTLSSSHTYAI